MTDRKTSDARARAVKKKKCQEKEKHETFPFTSRAFRKEIDEEFERVCRGTQNEAA